MIKFKLTYHFGEEGKFITVKSLFMISAIVEEGIKRVMEQFDEQTKSKRSTTMENDRAPFLDMLNNMPPKDYNSNLFRGETPVPHPTNSKAKEVPSVECVLKGVTHK